ncbi:MAG TPA: hypothetical protein VKB80_33875 [Kofleriaceae bacterium]|nr:hypothetical protein [Kofleriaceae bacterium]
MRRKAWVPGLVLLLAVTACGDDDDGSGGSPSDGSPGADVGGGGGGGDAGTGADGAAGGDASVGEYSVQFVMPWCGPADQGAVAVVLGEAGGDRCAVDDAEASVRLEVWTRDITAPVTFSFAPTEAMGSGIVCPGGEQPCHTFPTGDIRFDTYDEDSGATGSWRLQGGGQDTVTGTFDATWCDPDPPRPCG